MTNLPLEGAVNLLQALRERFGGDVVAHLYSWPEQIRSTTEIADLVECNFPGYAPQPVVSWGGPQIRSPTVEMIGAPVSWVRYGITPPAAQQALGAYYTFGGSLLWIDAIAGGGVRLAAEGEAVTLTPVLALRSLTF